MLPTYSKMQSEMISKIISKIHYKKIESESKLIQSVLESCVHILQEDFGSGFCISPKGYILSCHHCTVNGPDNDEPYFKMIFPNNEIVETYIILSDEDLDISLLKIVKPIREYPHCKIADSNENINSDLFCIGHPYYYDMETEKEGVKIKDHTPFYCSKGKVEGYEKNTIFGRKKEGLGPLLHSCWTYWGHSGSPIFNSKAEVIGIHNSWDNKNGMRHGASVDTIKTFLKKCELK